MAFCMFTRGYRIIPRTCWLKRENHAVGLWRPLYKAHEDEPWSSQTSIPRISLNYTKHIDVSENAGPPNPSY